MDTDNPVPESYDKLEAGRGPASDRCTDQNNAEVAADSATNSSSKHRREYWDDVRLLTILGDSRNERIDAWIKHVNTYGYIVSGGKCPPPFGNERIRFVAGHLDILDRKFGILLTFHGLMATLAGLYLNFALPHPLRHIPFLFALFALCWLATTALCLLGLVRATWGDLGKDKNAAKAEIRQVKILIEQVVSRTAMFRLAVPLTIIGILLFLASVAWTANDGGRANYSNSEPIATIGPFSPGVGCSVHPMLESRIKEAVSAIQRDRVRSIRIVGVTDAQPIDERAVIEYGNNVGLALTRARCTAGWLTDRLTDQGMHVEMFLSVRDPTDRSSHARNHGTPADRIVEIWPVDAPQ